MTLDIRKLVVTAIVVWLVALVAVFVLSLLTGGSPESGATLR